MRFSLKLRHTENRTFASNKINTSDMLTAHLSYWTDSSFAAFLLTEIFSTRLDIMRTGMGLANQPPPENGVNVLTSIKKDALR